MKGQRTSNLGLAGKLLRVVRVAWWYCSCRRQGRLGDPHRVVGWRWRINGPHREADLLRLEWITGSWGDRRISTGLLLWRINTRLLGGVGARCMPCMVHPVVHPSLSSEAHDEACDDDYDPCNG